MVPVFKDGRKAKNCCRPGFLSVVNKIFERLFNHLKKCGRFSNSQYSFRSSQSTVELLQKQLDLLIELLERLIDLMLSGLWYLI